MANGKTTQQFGMSWRKNVEPLFPCYYSEIDATKLRLAIDAVTRAGGAIMLSTTSDGGAFSVCVLIGSDKAKEYPHGTQEMEAVLEAITDEFVSR